MGGDHVYGWQARRRRGQAPWTAGRVGGRCSSAQDWEEIKCAKGLVRRLHLMLSNGQEAVEMMEHEPKLPNCLQL
jgi:hypothetical protein